ncbi:uncharacterized protein LOC114943846 [Nylanderia fulva]|uniref:uncharacterized protein LOC114943846 n=1 Tax=Nylanderia fulva TaxID=613905 RepID=UPI0010FB8AD4|nr:uncharacterized protein LOC114943846 [Nylanderia fulva]
MKQTNTSDKNANTEVQNEMISNVVLDNNLQCTNTSDNLTLKIPVVQLNKDNVNNNVDNDTVPCNGTDKSECTNETTKDFETLSKVINTEELTKQNQNKFDEKISTELVQNKSASNVILPECSSNIPIMQLNKGYWVLLGYKDTVSHDGIDESECIIKTTKNFQTLSKVVNTEELTTQNQNKLDEKISTELVQNKSISNVTLPECNLDIPVTQSNKDKKHNFCLYYKIF